MVLLRGLLCGAIAFVLLAFFYLRSPYLHDSDSYLHLSVARLYAEQGVVKELPWPRFSVMNESYGDKELLFHFALVPFVRGDAAIGGRLALAAMDAVIFTVITSILWQHTGWASALVPWWMVLAAAPWNDRLTRLRPELFAVALLLLAAEMMARRRWLLLALISALFALSYTAFHALIGMVVIWTIAVRWIERKWEWRPIAAAAGGVATGLLLHPHPIDHLQIWTLQNVTFFRLRSGLDVGPEIFAPPWHDVVLVLGGWWIPVIAVGAFAAARRRDLFRSREIAVYSLAALVFFGLYLTMGRMVIYFIPFATIAAAMIASRLEWTRNAKLAIVALMCVAVVPGVLFSMRTPFVAGTIAGRSPATEIDLERFARALPPSANVAAPWGSSSLFVFAAPDARYLNLYDPLFMAVAHPQEFEAQRRIFAGAVADVPPLLKSTLASDYLALHGADFNAGLRDVLDGDPRWRVLHSGVNVLLEAREPSRGHFKLDWLVSQRDSASTRYPVRRLPLEGFVELPRVSRDGSCRTFTAIDPCSGCALRFRAAGKAAVLSNGVAIAKSGTMNGLSPWFAIEPAIRTSLAVKLCGAPHAGFFLFAEPSGTRAVPGRL